MKKIAVVLLALNLLIENFSYNTLFKKKVELKNECSIVTLESFSHLFKEKKAKMWVEYTINTAKDKKNTVLEMLLVTQSKTYNVTLTVTDDTCFLENSDLYIIPMEGKILIDNKEYVVYSNITMSSNSEMVQVDSTIQSYPNDESPVAPVCFSFGEQLLRKDSFSSQLTEYNESCEYNENEVELRSFSFVDNQPKYFPSSSGVSGYSQQVQVYHDASSKRYSIGVVSYTNNVKNYYLSQGNPASVTVYVSHFSIRMKRSTSYAHNYIAGIESFGFVNFGQSGSALLPLFEDILSYLGVPTSTIMSAFSSAAATVTKSVYTNDITVSFNNMSATQAPKIDSLSCGAPIVFQMGVSSSGSDLYNAITTIKYGVIYVPNSTNPVGANLYTVNGVSTNLSFTVAY